MLGPADLVISAGHALRVRCTQAKDGSINVVISHQVESGGIDTLGLREDSPWQFSECKKADTHKIAFQFNTVGNSDIAGDIQRTALRQKIATKWEKTTGLLHQNVELWSKNPSAFFGADRFNTSEEWSYQSLRNSTSKLSSVFHKINLANCDDERIQRVKTHSPNFDMRQLRKSTLNSLHPGYGELGDQERNTIRKNFAEDISNGIVLRSLNERSWGLLLTIGPILSDRDLAFLSKHKATSWLCKEKLDTSKKFAKLALILLSYLEHKLTNFGYDPPISPTPTFILPLLHAMGGCVPTSLFDGTSSPRRMDEQGAWYEVPLSNSGLGQGIVKHLDINVLTSNLESLVAVSMITVHDSSYIYGDQPAWISSEQFRGYWINQAFRFCCYVFPRGPILDSFSVSTGKKLLHILSYILQIYTEIGQEPPHCEDTVETLFAASRLAEPDAKEHLLAMATKSEKCISRVYLQADVTYERSVMLRSKGQVSESERVIQAFLQRQNSSPESLRISLQRLRISHAYNQIYKFDFCTAHESLNWGPLRCSLSDGESVVLCDQLCCTARVLRGQGQFEEASRCFKMCLTSASLPPSKRHLIISHLSDLYCELDYVQRSNPVQEYLKEGKEIVSGELDRATQAKQHSKGFRRLQLSLIERRGRSRSRSNTRPGNNL